MFTKKHTETKLTKHFSRREAFSREELFAYLRKLDPELKESTFTWRIFDLKRRQLIKEVGKGVYSLEQKRPFKPEADEVMREISSILDNVGNHQGYNIWSTAWLNGFIELQATSFLYILEVDKASVEQVFFSLKDSRVFSNLFINPDGKIIEHYISELPQSIIVAPMISRAPVMELNDMVFPTLEKILVDLFCDPELYFAYQGQQLVKIFEASLSKYEINYSRLFNYAKRRHREDTLKAFLQEHQDLRKEVPSIIA